MRVDDESTLDVARRLRVDVDALVASPFVAQHYYAGQGCPLYALASTGTLVDGLAFVARRESENAMRAGEWEDGQALAAVATVADYLQEVE